jgi:hypothetical protein
MRPMQQPEGASRTTLLARMLPLLIALLGIGCGSEPTQKIEGRELTIACGMCIFEMPGAENCPFAADVDGKYYIMRGALPRDHLSHAAEGICNMPRRAIVHGEIRGELLHVSEMQMLDAQGVPEQPRFGAEDIH